MGRSRLVASTSRVPKPSKPPGCRSRARCQPVITFGTQALSSWMASASFTKGEPDETCDRRLRGGLVLRGGRSGKRRGEEVREQGGHLLPLRQCHLRDPEARV